MPFDAEIPHTEVQRARLLAFHEGRLCDHPLCFTYHGDWDYVGVDDQGRDGFKHRYTREFLPFKEKDDAA